MSTITKVKEINNVLFPDLNRDFKIYLLKESAKYINLKMDILNLIMKYIL